MIVLWEDDFHCLFSSIGGFYLAKEKFKIEGTMLDVLYFRITLLPVFTKNFISINTEHYMVARKYEIFFEC